MSQRWTLAARLALPLVLTDVISRANPTGDSTFGTGDLLLQGLLIDALDQRWALAGGVQLIFPTASQEQMGAGKYRLVPTGAFRLSLPEVSKGSFFAFLVRYDYDFAGDEDRPHPRGGRAVSIAMPTNAGNLYVSPPSQGVSWGYSGKPSMAYMPTSRGLGGPIRPNQRL